MATLEQLEKEINLIQERNKRVETEKAWETSWTRRLIVVMLTYTVISLVFFSIGTPNPLKNAIVPSIAFILSTLSGPFIKKFWLKFIHRR